MAIAISFGMAYGLQRHIGTIEKAGGLRRIREFVDPVSGVAAITAEEAAEEGGGKALLFENTGTAYPLLTNMMATDEAIASVLGCGSVGEASERLTELQREIFTDSRSFAERLRSMAMVYRFSRWMPVAAGRNAGCQEAIQFKPKSSSLPFVGTCLHGERGSAAQEGRYLDAVLNTKGTVMGERGASRVRLRLVDDESAVMEWDGSCAAVRHLDECTYRLPAAVCIGGDPIYSFLAATSTKDNFDIYRIAGIIRREAVRLAPCMTQKLSVPDDCDIVLEGYIHKSEAFSEEGFPIFHISCITHRRNAVCTALLPDFSRMKGWQLEEAVNRTHCFPLI